MRILLNVEMPHEPFNTLVREGTVQNKLSQILEELRPETAYFTEHDGHRGALLVVDIDEMAQVPKLAEPFFLTFNAHVHFQVCMTPDDFGKANIDALGQKWG